MAEPVIVPVRLECTDIDTSQLNFNDVSKEISKSMTGIKKSIQDAFNGIDPSAINKSIDKSMTAVTKSVQSLEDAQLRLKESMVRAGKSSEEYKSKLSEANSAISAQQALVNELSKLGPAVAPVLAEAQKELSALLEARSKINPIDFVDKAEPIQLEKVANAYKKVLTATENVNTQSEKFNQSVKDNRVSDEYSDLLKQAETYKKKLEELNEKSKRMETLGATDKQWEALQYDTEQVSSALDEVIKKMRAAVKTGSALRFGDGPKGDLSRQINSLAMSGGNRRGTILKRSRENQSPYTEDYQNALNELDKLEKKMQAVKEKSEKMIALGASKKQFESLVYDAEKLQSEIDEAGGRILNMVKSGNAFKFGNGNSGAEISKVANTTNALHSSLGKVVLNAKKAQGGLTALGATHPKLAAVLTVAGKVANVIVKGFSGAAKVISKVGSAVGKVTSVFVRLGKGIISGIRNMRIFGKTGSKTSTDLQSRFKKLSKNILMWGLGFRTAYYAIKRLRNIFVESFKIMGERFAEVGNPLKTMMQSFERLKGSLATAFQPIVSVLMPILTRFMNYLSGALEKLGEFTAVLSGQKSIYKAVAKDINSVAGAAKNANNQLGSYDKLEVIQDNNTGYDYEQTTVGDAQSAASNFANMVKAAWEKADFTSVGVYVTEQLLKILDNVEQNIVPKVTTFVNKLLKSVNTFIDGFDSNAIGGAVGSIFNAITDGLDWSQLGKLFANLNNVVWRFLSGLASSIDWAVLGTSISEGLVSMVTTLDFNSLAGMATGFTMGLITVVSNIDWGKIANTLINGVLTILQSVGTAMASSNNPLVASFGNIILSLNEAITSLIPAVEAIISAVSPIIQSILPIISQLLPPIAELISQAVVMVMPVLVSLFESVMPILSQLIATLMPLFMDLLVSLQPIFDALITTVLPVIVHLLDACMPLIQGVLKLVTNLLAPILSLIGPLIEIIFNIIDPIITILEPVLDVLGVLCDVLGAVLRPILDVLTPILSAISSSFKLLGTVVSVLMTPFNLIANVIKLVASVLSAVLIPIISVVMTVIEAMAKAFQLVATTITNAFQGLKNAITNIGNAISNVINGILAGLEKFINGLIKAVNGMIKAMNKLSFDIPDWIPGLGGKKFGFNIKEISEIKIPRLAQGAVIPPNKEFLAMLGDQKHGTNIEAPLDTIKQALAEVLAEVGGGGREPIVLQVSGRTLAKVVWDEQEKRYKQTGKA